MPAKYDTEAARKRLDEIEARLKAAQGKSEFSKKAEKDKPKKALKYKGLNVTAAKQIEESEK